MSVNYTEYDYEDLVEQITEKLQNKPGFTDAYESSTSQTLIQLLADINDSLAFMLERRAQESFINTAQLDTSIRSRASELGYRPRRRVSSTGTLDLTIVDEDENPVVAEGNIFIPKGTAVTSEGENYVTTQEATIATGESTVSIPVKEGILVDNQYNFDIDPYNSDPTITIPEYENIEEFSIEITDADGIYQDVGAQQTQTNITSLSYALPNDALYDIRFAREGMRIVFGDDEFGKKPSGVVNVSWIESSGDEVTVISTGLDFEFESEFLEDDQNITPQPQYRYTLTNSTPIRGGQDEETSSDIARNAPLFSRTANRAVTAGDHEFWVLRSGIGDIVDVNVFGEQESGDLIYNMNNVNVAYVTGDQLELNVEQRQQLNDFMERYKIITTHLVFMNATQVELVLDIDFKRDPNLPISNEQLYQVVKDYVDEYFEVKRGSIGGQFQHSELVRFLQNRTFMFNGINYPITDWVRVSVIAQYPISIPIDQYDVLIYIDDSYGFVDGDEWTIVLDGDPITVLVQSGDDKPTLVERMRQEIFDQTNFLTAAELDDGDTEGNGSILRIKSPFVDETFTLDLSQGDLTTFVTTDSIFPIPASTFTNPGGDDLILPGSVVVVDENEDPVFEDDGAGMMQPVSGVSEPAFEVDYVNSTFLSPTMATGDYFIRFQQNEYQNFDANRSSVLVLSPLADNIDDPFLYSKLRILQ